MIVARRFENFQTLDRFSRRVVVVNQNAVRLSLAASDSAAQLVKLRKTEAISVDDEHDRGVRNVDAELLGRTLRPGHRHRQDLGRRRQILMQEA